MTTDASVSQAINAAIAANDLPAVQQIIATGKAQEAQTPQTDANGNPVPPGTATDPTVTIVN